MVQLAATRFMREEDQTSGEQRLVAYLVKRPDAIIDARQIRSYLRDYLPDYMLPTNFVILETLPLSPNGKVNRQALPAPNQLSLDVQASYVAPRSAFEELLTGIWTEVLRLERVGMHDNFFEIGGHSLVATQVVARLREALQQEVPLRSIFEAPTIAGLAQRLENRLPGSVQRPVLPLHLFSRPAHPPLSFAQQRLWFLAQLEPSTPAYNLPIAMRLSGRLEVGALKHALDDIVERHEVLRTTFALHKGSPIQRVSPSLALPLPVINLSALAPAQREMLARQLVGQETRWPFDLTQGPLLRVSLLRLQDELHLLLLTMHHIIMDGWSLGVLLRELSTLYRAHVQGEPLPFASAACAVS